MKRSTALVAAAIGILVVGAYWIGQNQNQAQAQGRDKKDADKRIVTTSGSATIRIKPDSARVFFTVETYAEQIRDARADNAQKTRKILDAIKALKLPNLKTKSDNVNVDLVRSQDRTPTTLPKLLGFHITNSFTVLVENEDAVKLGTFASQILDAGLENGATGVSRIMFFKKNEEGVRREALTKAVEDAMTNARALARGADEKVLESLTINNEPRYFYPRDGLSNTVNVQDLNIGGQGGTPVVVGALEITCTVNVTARY
jgi:uncharacterized protein YggE